VLVRLWEDIISSEQRKKRKVRTTNVVGEESRSECLYGRRRAYRETDIAQRCPGKYSVLLITQVAPNNEVAKLKTADEEPLNIVTLGIDSELSEVREVGEPKGRIRKLDGTIERQRCKLLEAAKSVCKAVFDLVWQRSYVLLAWKTEKKGAVVGEEGENGGDEGGRGVEAVLDVSNECERPWSPDDVVDRQFVEVELAIPERCSESTKTL
jgi:hypothetical protein